MSGIVAAFRGDGAPVDPAPVSAMLRALAHRGPDGRRLVVRTGAALGHQHFWTTPEEVGEEQPLSRPPVDLALDGRIDNREELLGELGLAGGDSDARLLLAAWERWGPSCFARLIGPFAAVVLDARARTLAAARDAMGARALFFHERGPRLLVASEESALLAHPAVSRRLDERHLAEFFIGDGSWDGATAFAEIRELRPGHLLVAGPEGRAVRRFRGPDVRKRIRYAKDEDYAEHYRELLSRAVSCRLRAVSRPAVLLSGGLDSTAVAALAAAELAHRGTPPLRSLSWVFDELTGCERRWISPVVDRLGLEATFLPGDGAWPLRVPGAGSTPSTPWRNPFALLKEQAFEAAAASGSRVVLYGGLSDLFYVGDDDWLLDLARDGHVARFTRSLAVLARSGRRAFRDAGLRRLVRTALKGGRPSFERTADGAPWLTPYARRLLGDAPVTDGLRELARRPEQYEILFGPLGRTAAAEIPWTSARGVEVRDPYRDLRLAEFMLAVPAHQLLRDGTWKHVHRRAMRDLLPAEVVDRNEPTTLLPLYERGLFERELEPSLARLRDPNALWRRFVDAKWLFDFYPRKRDAPVADRSHLVPWQCLSAQIWSEGLETRKPERKIILDDEVRFDTAAA